MARLIQIGPQRFMDAALAAREGLREYIPSAVPKSAARSPLLDKPALKPKTPARRPTKAYEFDSIPEAMRAGATNEQIHALISCDVLRRPSLTWAAASWSGKDWRWAHQRGLIW